MMLFLLLPVFLAYVPTSLASSAHRFNPRQSDDGDLDHFVYPQWSILNFDGACSPGGCVLTFHLSSAATTSEPAISVACAINGDEIRWQPCTTLAGIAAGGGGGGVGVLRKKRDEDEDTDSSIWAMPLSAVDEFAVSVQHRFSNTSLTPTKYYNVTGNMTVDFEVVTLPVNLTVMGTRVSEVWSWTTGRTADGAGDSRAGSRE